MLKPRTCTNSLPVSMLQICFYILAYVWFDAGAEGSQHTLSFLCSISWIS